MEGRRLCTHIVLCLVVVSLAGGCSSAPQGRQRSTKTVDTLAKVQAEMEKGIAQIDVTLTSLQNLVSKPEGDLATAYKDYHKQVGRLDAMARDVASRNQSLRARAKQYFASWEKENAEIKSAQIRSVSAERRAAAQASFDRMVAKVAEGREALTPMMEEFRDIELYLANDLTSAGVAAVKPIAVKAVADAKKVKDALRSVMGELSRIPAELSPTPTN